MMMLMIQQMKNAEEARKRSDEQAVKNRKRADEQAADARKRSEELAMEAKKNEEECRKRAEELAIQAEKTRIAERLEDIAREVDRKKEEDIKDEKIKAEKLAQEDALKLQLAEKVADQSEGRHAIMESVKIMQRA